MKRALISVSDKTNIIDLAKKLINLNYDIISTGGTLKTLVENNIKATAISNITGFPEIMNGRVKTLHPKIHGGILYERENEEHLSQAKEHQIQAIDLVVINLYPFEKVKNNENSTWDEIIENIDIGGPAMIRASAKNYKYVTVLTDVNDYEIVLSEIENNGDTTLDTRLRLAQKAFALTAEYDGMIASFFSTTPNLSSLEGNFWIASSQASRNDKEGNLRYGENPHQSASYYNTNKDLFTQLHGKELSYNNLLDMDAALKTIIKFKALTVAILKHTNPCGIASDNNISIAYDKAFATDTVSPFGGIVVTNGTVNPEFVEVINKVFTEVLIAPDYTAEALDLLKKKKDRRLIKYHADQLHELIEIPHTQSCLNGHLKQMADLIEDNTAEWTYPTKAKPTDNDLDELLFAWQVVKMLKSNSICFTKNKQTIGLGIGQTSRIDALNIAIESSIRMNLDLSGSVCASDGFFPFRDSIDAIAKIGVKCIIQPGGSKADPEVIQACDEYGIAMVMTGRRHFRH